MNQVLDRLVEDADHNVKPLDAQTRGHPGGPVCTLLPSAGGPRTLNLNPKIPCYTLLQFLPDANLETENCNSWENFKLGSNSISLQAAIHYEGTPFLIYRFGQYKNAF